MELGIIIGRRGKHIPEEKALNYVAGYAVFNDVTIRDIQFEGQQGLRFFWLGKSFQDSAVLGPALVTPDEAPDPHDSDLIMHYNDRLVRIGNTRNYVFNVEQMVAFYSKFFTLEPGDVIAGGCPPATREGVSACFFSIRITAFYSLAKTASVKFRGWASWSTP